ncbi:MAG: hypothetical protein GXP24_14355 [Planctomycetes bacterium]|nr:hypothetical protein [Planctomycetota bacterium]
MSTAIALYWNESALHYVVVQDQHVDAAASVDLESGLSPVALGQRMAEALAPYSPGRAKVVVALGRGALEWQHLLLPPCTADELPDVVRLQADRELRPADEDLGFDFLPLVGDEKTPQEVLTVALEESELAKIRKVCRAANLTLERIVPLAAGWPALLQQAAPDAQLGTQIFVAPQAKDATLWATRAGHVVLLRQFQLASNGDPVAYAGAISGELRRTLLTLSQHEENGNPVISLVSNQRDHHLELAKTLDEQLEAPVQLRDVTAQHPNLSPETLPTASTLPLVGLAIDESQANKPLVDLLHPRKRPQKKIDVRTYALAVVAGTLLIGSLGWSSYSKLSAPLKKAAKDQAELTLLEESLDDLKADEERAASIRDWQGETPNVLRHLQQVSKSIRPNPLEDEEFVSEQDVVLEKLVFDKRHLTLEALARDNKAVQPLESRLRESAYRPQRGKSEPSEKNKAYPWHFRSTIEITTVSDSFDASESSTPTEISTTDSPTTVPSASDSSASDPSASDPSTSKASEDKKTAEPQS